MKSREKLFYVFVFLPLTITFIALFFMPDNIPLHYGTDGLVNRWGSKFELLILPIFTIPFGFFLKFIGKHSSKKETNGNNVNEEVTLFISNISLLVFNVLTVYFLFASFHKVNDTNHMSIDLYRLIFCILGLALIIIGNMMPKLKLNSIVGLRTRWSLKNEKSWSMSQRFGGISFMITGALMIVGSLLFFKGEAVLFYSGILLILDLIISVIYTYHASKLMH